MGKDLESQMEAHLREVEAQVYGETDKEIAEERRKEEDVIATSNIWVKQLAEIRKDFDLILQYITKITEDTEV